MSGGTALGNTYAASKLAKLEGVHFVVALALGLVIAVFCIWFVRVVGRVVLQSPSCSERKIKLVYLFTFLWLILAGVVGFQLEKLFIHFALLQQ